MHSHTAFLVPPRAAGQGSPAKVKASGPFWRRQEKKKEKYKSKKRIWRQAAPPACAPAAAADGARESCIDGGLPGCACPSNPPMSLVTHPAFPTGLGQVMEAWCEPQAHTERGWICRSWESGFGRGCLPERCSTLLEPPSPHNTQQPVTTEMLNPQNHAGMSGLAARLRALKLGLGNGCGSVPSMTEATQEPEHHWPTGCPTGLREELL